MIYYLEDNRRRFLIYITNEKLPEAGKDFYKAIKITKEYWTEVAWCLGDENQGGNKTIDNGELIDYLNKMFIYTIFTEKLDEM